MQITLLPSSDPGPGREPHQFLTTFVINDTVAIDAGSLGFFLPAERQLRIRHILLSHSHIDHTASLPVFVENVYGLQPQPVAVYGNDAVLACLQEDLFNDRTWPDFIALSRRERPFLTLHRLEPFRPLVVDGLRVTPVPVDHVVPTMGFVLEDERSAVVIVSDTGPTEAIWQAANQTPNLRAVFLEASFPDEWSGLATIAKHLTPALFACEVRKLTRPATCYAVHIKPRFLAEVAGELARLGLPNVEIARPGHVYEF